jgi:acyl-CoA thioesterase-2
MRPAVAELLATLDLEPLERNLYRGRSPQVGWQRVFGGQVIGQALVAANRTVDDGRPAHSLHGYFMRPGDPSVPIIYEVDRVRDGRSFSTRRVLGIQHGEAIFSMSASYHNDEDGLTHAVTAPDVPRPEDLPDEAALREIMIAEAPENIRRYFERERPIELRPVDLRHYLSTEPLEPAQHVWVRATDRLPDDPAVHRAVLAYLSDMTLFDTALFPHGLSVFNRSVQVASLDHAMWFHRPFRADEWLLYAQDSPTSSGARGFTRGSIFALDGTLVASTAQEGLMRRRREATGGEQPG